MAWRQPPETVSEQQDAVVPPRKKRILCPFGNMLERPDALPADAANDDQDGSPWWFRKEQCCYEALGNCWYGDRCNFKHTGAVKSKEVPKYRWREQCHFELMGNCRWGADCYFKHSEGVAPPPTPVADVSWSREHRRAEPRDELEAGGVEPCPLFQLGCCWFERTCNFRHEGVPPDRFKITLCSEYVAGSCANDKCPNAHGTQELRTPSCFRGMPGYKACLCTSFVALGGCKDDNCFDAHGQLDLRRQVLSMPKGVTCVFSDAHVHLDHVLLSRKYGTYWFYKSQRCRFADCSLENCMWLHNEEKQARTFDMTDFEAWAAEIVALPGRFGGCVHSCCDPALVEEAVNLVTWGRELLDGKIYVTFGVHPTTFELFTPTVEAQLEAALDKCGSNGVGFGECGLDYYRRKDTQDPSVRAQMMGSFSRQAQIAVRRGLPLIVHSRDAEADTLQVLRENVPRSHPVHLHSFMGSVDVMNEFLDEWSNGLVGLTGAITYETAEGLCAIARALPLERLLLETDGPYMAPVPYRGEESHSGLIPWIAAGVARVKGLSTTEVLTACHQNFQRFFGVS